MALSKDGQYIKVEGVFGDKNFLRCVVSFTKDEQRVTEKEYFYNPSMSADNFIKQSYEHLKTFDEFAGATDV